MGKKGLCKTCQNAYSQSHYRENKVAYNARRLKWRQTYVARLTQWLLEQKTGKPCADCREVYEPFAMDFDHRDPSTKVRNVGDLVGLGVPLRVIEAEAAKCDLVCAVCHRYRTHGVRRVPKGP